MSEFEMPKGTYYIDATGGNDSNDGTSPEQAWKSLDKVNNSIFAPGSKLLMKKGETWIGKLSPKGSGTEGEIILLSSYGDGNQRPVINGNGCENGAVELYNQEYWEISRLEVTNKKEGEVLGDSAGNKSTRHGILIRLENFDVQGDYIAEHIYVKDCYVHDVVGNLSNPHNGVGIFYFVADSTDKSRFNDVLIDGNDVRNIDRSGIIIRSQDVSDPDRTYNTNVIIQNNYLENIAGDGIVAKVCKEAIVQYNVCNATCVRPTGGNVSNVAIWVWQCKNSVIQFNEAYNTGLVGGNQDGEAFDSDFNCEGCIIQYNYSHDNNGGFILLIAPSSKDFNKGTIVRYNISENDKKGIFEIAGATEGARIYNNTVYQSQDTPTTLLRVNTYWGESKDVLFQNNIFCSEKPAITLESIENGRPLRGDITLENNLFMGYDVPKSENKEVNEYDTDGKFYTGYWTLTVKNSVEADPKLANPGNGGIGVDFTDNSRLAGYRLTEGSPAINAEAICPETGWC